MEEIRRGKKSLRWSKMVNCTSPDDSTVDEETNEEALIYRERLREVEVAFRYNLQLLSERDNELDVLEERLRDAIAELERLSRQKTESDNLLKRIDEEKRKETKALKSDLAARDKMILQLERQNESNVKALRKALHDLREEQCSEKTRMADKYELEKCRMEKGFIRAFRLQEVKHSEEVVALNRKIAKQLDEIAEGKRIENSVKAENERLRMRLAKTEKEQDLMCRQEMTRRTLQMESKETATHPAPETTSTAAQTQAEAAHSDVTALREQNEVLKGVIKSMKRSLAAERERESGSGCAECRRLSEKVDRAVIRFDAEINEMREAAERERAQRSEEEVIMQNLEATVACLKEKLLASLCSGADGPDGPDGDCSSEQRESDRLLEERLGRRIARVVAEERDWVARELAVVRRDCTRPVSLGSDTVNRGGVPGMTRVTRLPKRNR